MNQNTPNPPIPNLPRIENMVLAGVMETCTDLFGLPKDQIIFFATTNRMQVAERIKQLREGAQAQLKWPLVFVHVTGFEDADGSDLFAVSPKTLAREGINVHMADTQNMVLNVKIVPVVFEVEVVYVDDDWKRSFQFACEWMASAKMNRMNFSMTYMNVDFDVRTKMNPSFTTPDRDEAVNQSNQFEYTGSFSVGGYVQASGADAISKVSVIRQVQSNIVEKPLPQKAALKNGTLITKKPGATTTPQTNANRKVLPTAGRG
jgi:hypothetical protein